MPGRVKCGGMEGEIGVAHGHLPSPTQREFNSKTRHHDQGRIQLFNKGGGQSLNNIGYSIKQNVLKEGGV